MWSKFEFINITHIQDGIVKSATSCDRDVENRFFVHDQATSCYTLNESICNGFISQLKSRLGEKLDMKKFDECSDIARATNDAFTIINKIMKTSENSEIAESGMRQAIKYANDLGKEINEKSGVPWKDNKSQGKFEEWMAKSRFNPANTAQSIINKCYHLNLVKDDSPVEGVDYKKAGREAPATR